MKTKLTFELINTSECYEHLINFNEGTPFKKRLVTIELTEEQSAEIVPRSAMVNNGRIKVTEIRGGIWVEDYEKES